MRDKRTSTAAVLLGWCSLFAASGQAEDWRQWRGPTGDNHAPPGATAPLRWSETEGLAWKTRLPGRGHSSPVLVGDQIYITTSDASADTQSLLIFDRRNGRLLKQEVVHSGGLPDGIHGNNSHASPTVASDGQRVFTVFGNSEAAMVTAFDLDGRKLWQQKARDYRPQTYRFGYGTSPVLVGDTLVVTSEFDGDESGIAALDAATGAARWDVARPAFVSYSPPARLSKAGQPALLLSGNRQVVCLEPSSGHAKWSTPIPGDCTCGTMVWDRGLGLAFVSGGYPDRFTLAVQLDGDHEVVWKNSVMCYEQSLLAVDGHVYGVSQRGVAYCWRGADGKEMWRQRLGPGGAFSASPVLVDGKIYVPSEAGTVFVYRANPEKFELLAENQLGTEAFATPTPADGRLYHRYAAEEGGRRQEYLVAIGK